MAILLSRSPRKSNFVVVDGKRWVVDWGSGGMELWKPVGLEIREGEVPGYEVDRSGEIGESEGKVCL